MVLGFLVRLSVSWSLGFAVLGARSSWGSHTHPLVWYLISLVLLISFVSLVVISLVVKLQAGDAR